MATRPAPNKKSAPAAKAAAKKTAPATAKSKPVAAVAKKAAPAPVVTLKTVFEQLGQNHDLAKKQTHALTRWRMKTDAARWQAAMR
jgi:hypothetical protein